jgi:ribose transport system permease protein
VTGRADEASRQGGLAWHSLRLLVDFGILPIVLVATYIAFGLVEPAFFSAANAINILTQSSYLIILATGQMFALLTRGFDLSAGNVLSMISVSTALIVMAILGGDAAANSGLVPLALAVGLACGLLIGVAAGAFNGFVVAIFRINPFIVTLGTYSIAQGLASTLSGGFPVFNLPSAYTEIFSRGSVLGVPAPVAICCLMLALAYVILNHTVLGRGLYVLGGNPRAAHVAGLSSRLHNVLAYVLCSTFVAVAALLLTARTGSGEPNLGGGLMLQSIAAAIIGGVSLRGGEGRVVHCIVGGLFVTVLSVGMNLARVDGYIQQIVLGIVVVAAVCLDTLRRRIKT